ncbi:MAG: CocE/NonD family hydrolase [Actinomycetota bacterium]
MPGSRRLFALLTALLLLTSLGTSAVRAQTGDAPDDPIVFAPQGLSADRFPKATTFEHVEIPAHDGVMLSSRVYRPDTSSDPEWKTPIILVHSPYYGNTPARSQDLVDRYTPKGYTVVLSSVRGTGDSGGCLEQDSPNQAKDFKTLVEYFGKQPWSNGKVGSYGKSYDAETQNAGAVLHPKGLVTMVTVAGIASLYDVAYFDGVPLAGDGALSAASYTLPDGTPADRTRISQREGCQPDNYVNAMDPSGDLTPYWASRDFRFGVKNVAASVLYVQGLNDFTVAPIDMDGWYDELPGFKRAILGQWQHYYPYDAPASIARSDWYQAVDAWFDHELLGLPTGIESWPPVQVQDEANTWRAVDSVAGMGVEHTLPLGSATLGEPGATGSTATYPETGSATWDGPVLSEPLHLSGQAFLDATIALDRPDGHLAVTLEEVKTGGAVRTLTRGYLSVQHQEDMFRGHAITPGYPVPYRVRTYPFDKTLAAGSRLRLVLGGFDSFTLPAATGYTATVAVDGASVLRIPVVEQECGLLVAQRSPPLRAIPDCADQQIPAAVPRFTPDAARGHLATARVLATKAETIGGVAVTRQSGYLQVRDGTELAFEVVRPADSAAHPTLFTYDGYDAGTNPDSSYVSRYLPRGYAFVGLSVRGTGCSGGVFDFFQPSEGPDGFEMIEWIARQSWSNGHIGMIGKSYPGITQLFVAETRPPHLDAIAPGHFFADAYRDVAFPGGILNYGFASLWSFIAQPSYGFEATPGELGAGDQTCGQNLTKWALNTRTNPFLQAQEHPYDEPFIQSRSPLRNLGRIDVPVYTALAWQDEQLGSRQTHCLRVLQQQGITYRAVLSNGDHGMYRRNAQMAELDRFLEAYVEGRDVLRDGTTREQYLAEPPVTVYWEQGGQQPRWKTTLDGWGDQAKPMRLYLAGGEALSASEPAAAPASDSYAHSAAGSQGIGNPKYGSPSLPDVSMWDKLVPPRGAALAYTSAPFASDTVLLGSASADLWITATAPNVDLQVTMTEIRPDGQEVYVQQGWLRTKQRALDPWKSTELLPVQTHRAEDVQPLSATEPSLARVEVFPFGHVFRKGSRIRIWIEAPTVLPQLWAFALDPTPAQVQVWRDAAHPSSIALPLAEGVHLPPEAIAQPACGSVSRQPCRPDPRPLS